MDAPSAGYYGYQDVDVQAPDNVWLAGRQDMLLQWDGANFITHTLPVQGMTIFEVEALAAANVWANSRWNGLWHWDGNVWSEVDTPIPEESTVDHIQMLTADNGWAIVGDWKSKIYHWDGSGWQLHSNLNGTAESLYMLANGLGWAGRGLSWNRSAGGKIYQWNGANWHGTPTLRFDLVRAVDGVAADDIWAVGEEGTLLHYDGQSWRQATNPSDGFLSDVEMLSATDGWAVGNVTLHWDGTAWTQVAATGATKLDMLSADDGWAVAHDEILHWDGSAWHQAPISGTVLYPGFRDISMVSSTDGWATGEIGDGHGLLLRWDGVSWTEAPFADANYNILGDVEMVSSTDGWMSGQDGLYRWNGTTWNEVTHPSPFFLWSVEMVDAEDGWAVGVGGIIMRWDGTSWSLVDSPTSSELYDLAVFPGAAWASGYAWSQGGNSLLKWEGGSWTNALEPVAPTGASYWDITFEPGGTGWAVGEFTRSGFPGVATRWDGTRWLPVFFPARDLLLAVDAAADDDAWSIGMQGNAYHWDGARWTAWPLYDGELSYYTTSVSMASRGDAWATVNGQLRRWTGSAWETVPVSGDPYFSGVDMLDDEDGWAVGGAGAAVRWNGSEWLDFATGQTDNLTDVDALDGDDVWAVADDAVFHWNGSAWQSWPLPFDRAAHIAMLANDDGWVTSYDGESAHWDGSAWTQVPFPMTTFNQGIAYTPEGVPWIASREALVYFGMPPATPDVQQAYLPIVLQSVP